MLRYNDKNGFKILHALDFISITTFHKILCNKVMAFMNWCNIYIIYHDMIFGQATSLACSLLRVSSVRSLLAGITGHVGNKEI